MYIAKMPCGCDGQLTSGALGGMSEFDPVSAGLTLLRAASGPGGGSSGGGSAGTQVAVNTSTQVSPQISPQFVQQSSPSNSPVSFSPVQNANPIPGLPATGFIPGFDAGSPASIGASYLYPQSGATSTTPHTQYALAAGVLVALALAYKHRAKIAGHARRSYARVRGAFR